LVFGLDYTKDIGKKLVVRNTLMGGDLFSLELKGE
jgi:hypothetical protein